MITCNFDIEELEKSEETGIINAIKELAIQGEYASDQWADKDEAFQKILKNALNGIQRCSKAYLIITSLSEMQFLTITEKSFGKLALYCDPAFVNMDCVLMQGDFRDQLNVYIGKVRECFDAALSSHPL